MESEFRIAEYIPAWLEDHRLPDELAQDAYENCSSQWRALIKTGLALAHFHYGDCDEVTSQSRRRRHSGFQENVKMGPAPWVMLVFECAYAAAARMAAAAVAPILADVDSIIAISVGGAPTKPALVALELAGVEDIFILTEQQTGLLARELIRFGKPGRLVCLHGGALNGVLDSAREIGLPHATEVRPPRLLLASPDSFEPDALLFAHGFMPDTTGTGFFDAIFATTKKTENDNMESPLILTPGCEGFWLQANMGPAFFKNSSQTFAFYPQNPE